MINVADPAELDAVDPGDCDGIGLMRTEFLFHGRERPARRGRASTAPIAACSNGRATSPVTIRTLDAGGDKPIAGLTQRRRDRIRSSACAAAAVAARVRMCSGSSCGRWPAPRSTAISRSCCRW